MGTALLEPARQQASNMKPAVTLLFVTCPAPMGPSFQFPSSFVLVVQALCASVSSAVQWGADCLEDGCEVRTSRWLLRAQRAAG